MPSLVNSEKTLPTNSFNSSELFIAIALTLTISKEASISSSLFLFSRSAFSLLTSSWSGSISWCLIWVSAFGGMNGNLVAEFKLYRGIILAILSKFLQTSGYLSPLSHPGNHNYHDAKQGCQLRNLTQTWLFYIFGKTIQNLLRSEWRLHFLLSHNCDHSRPS